MSANPRNPKQTPVRSVLRALRIIVELNNQRSASAAELSRAVGLPRPTVHRILETLVAAGYVSRDAADQRYRPDASVTRLSIGYAEEDWLRRFAVNPMQELAADTKLEIAIATQSGLAMLVRILVAGDVDSVRLTVDSRVPLLASASGILSLAFAEPGPRALLLRRLAWSENSLDAQAANSTALARVIELVAERGYAVSYRSADSEFSKVLAVPVLPDGQFLAALILRTGDAQLTHEQVVHRHLHAMQRAADRCREGFERRVEELEGSIPLLRPAANA